MSPIVTKGPKPKGPKPEPVAESVLMAEWIDPTLLGARFWIPVLGIVCQYKGTILADDGTEMYALAVIDKGRQGFRLGSVFAWPAQRTRRMADE